MAKCKRLQRPNQIKFTHSSSRRNFGRDVEISAASGHDPVATRTPSYKTPASEHMTVWVLNLQCLHPVVCHDVSSFGQHNKFIRN
jgi:hypothetical protein